MMGSLKIISLIFALHLLQGSRTSMIELKNNGYEGIVIAINPQVPEDAKIIQQIQDMVTEASTYLFKATKKMVYFKNVAILIPETWQDKPGYLISKRESYKTADVIVAEPSPVHSDTPYTQQTAQCGEPGKYIHFTPKFLAGDLLREHGPLGRVFAHEWAHLRWGVYDEYDDKQPFYISSDGFPEATRCSSEIEGKYIIKNCQGGSCAIKPCKIDRQTGLFEEGCMFIPEEVQIVTTSLMYMQSFESVVEFCTARNHNAEAPNLQNRMCNHRSTWEVIQDSADFNNSKPMTDQPPKPVISLLKSILRRVCLVLDKSGSMSNDDRLNRMNQAAKLFLLQTIEEGSWAGMVTFDSSAKLQHQLIQIVNETERKQLITTLPAAAGGGTSICSGIRAAFQEFKNKFQTTDGSEIVLLTDGEDSSVSSCFEEVKQSGATIHAIALGPSAAMELRQLAEMTGGVYSTPSDAAQNNGLIDAFSGLSSRSGNFSQQSIQLESRGLKLNTNGWMNGTVIVDTSVGKDTFFLVTWSAKVPDISLWDPKGRHHNFSIDEKSRMAHLQVPGTAEVGSWTYSIESSAQILTMTVTSRSSDPTVPPLTVTPHMNKDTNAFPSPLVVYAEVSQGFLPVLGAKVIATIEHQSGKIVTLELLDNGAGADVTANDGVYSRYFTSYENNGRYSLKVQAVGGKNRLNSSPQQSRAMYVPGYIVNGEVKMNPPKPEINPEDIQSKVENFSRTALGSSFEITSVPSGVIPDMFAPSKITDLVANIEEDEIHLTWTAPGDDYDIGQATGYIIKMSDNVLELRDRFDDALQVNTSTLKPKEAHSRETFAFRPENVTIANGTSIFIAVQAFDKANQTSEISNIAQAALFIPPPDPHPADTGKKSLSISTIVLAVTGSVVLVAIVVSSTVCVLKSKNNRSDRPQTTF
ncbi:calcium-activated chloride channel regulator 1-like [Tachyglossus aculeatus]|uniref:calcium-activated chloride channel regulator 1-like n=1 Tax=Tachyglossus aculeatus TaxID=9261 RepID=UPI0018F506F6|nr:calcium-activated chloride channel regulator 1-like [Tachyglossus aculeatus]